MRHIIAALIVGALCIPGYLLADGRVFPPDNCTDTNSFMAFNGVTAGGNTYCINGQQVLSNAIPNCAPDQIVSHDGSKFYCKDGGTPPACAAGEFLTSDGAELSCSSTNVPTCAANYVLTYNGSSFVCVPKSASVPTCAANQFLTYNGTSFQCAATQSLTIPNCPAGQVLTGSGGSLACVPASSSQQQSGAWCGFVSANCGDQKGGSGADPTPYAATIPINIP